MKGYLAGFPKQTSFVKSIRAPHILKMRIPVKKNKLMNYLYMDHYSARKLKEMMESGKKSDSNAIPTIIATS